MVVYIYMYIVYMYSIQYIIYVSESESCSAMSDSVTAWIIQSMGVSRSEYQSEQPLHSPGDLPNPGIKPRSPAKQASLPAEPPVKPNTGVSQPIPSPEDLPDSAIKPGSPALQADSLPTELSRKHIAYQFSQYTGNGNPLQSSCLGESPYKEVSGGLQSMGLQSQTLVSD